MPLVGPELIDPHRDSIITCTPDLCLAENSVEPESLLNIRKLFDHAGSPTLMDASDKIRSLV